MAEDKNKMIPEAENESTQAAGSDEAITEIADALEKKLQDDEEKTVAVEETPEPTDDDVLNEIKEALNKAEAENNADDLLTDSSPKATESKFERITEEDFTLPAEMLNDSKASDTPDNDADAEDQKDTAPETAKGNWQPRTADSPAPKGGSRAERPKKLSPLKIILIILAFIIVAVGTFALVHYVIAPNLGGSGGGDSSSQTDDATKDELDTIAPTESGYALMAENAMENMSRREKICQLFIVTPEKLMNTETTVTQADNTTKEMLGTYPVGGVIFTQQNLTGEDQAKALISDTQSYSKIPLFIAVDDDGIISPKQDAQSGGPGANPGEGPGANPGEGPGANPGQAPGQGPGQGPGAGPGQAPGGDQNGDSEGQDPSEQTDNTDPDSAYEEAVETSTEKHDVGFNLDFTLNADISEVKESDPELTDNEAYTLLSSAVKGCNDGGVIPTLKYFPINRENSTDDSATAKDGFFHIDRTADELDNGTEFAAFRSGTEAGAGMVMVDHIFVDKLDTEKPATLSSTVVPQLLRQKLNYQGVAITGNMSADYFTTAYLYSTIVKGIFDSDIDVILNPNSIQSYVEEIEKELESGTITDDQLDAKVKRILTLKYEKGIISDTGDSADSTESSGSSESNGASDSTNAIEETALNEATKATELTAPTE